MNDDEQFKYCSGVGSLLYLLKHLRRDLSNSLRELSKVMDGANKSHQKALCRIKKFLAQTRDQKLMLCPNTEEMKAYSDSDFSGDTDTQKRVSSFISYLCEAAIAWRSNGQKSVSLSSSKAEYMAVLEVAMEILYIVGTFKFLGIQMKYSIEVKLLTISAQYILPKMQLQATGQSILIQGITLSTL